MRWGRETENREVVFESFLREEPDADDPHRLGANRDASANGSPSLFVFFTAPVYYRLAVLRKAARGALLGVPATLLSGESTVALNSFAPDNKHPRECKSPERS